MHLPVLQQLRAAFHHFGLCVAPDFYVMRLNISTRLEHFTPAKVDINALNVQPVTRQTAGVHLEIQAE